MPNDVSDCDCITMLCNGRSCFSYNQDASTDKVKTGVLARVRGKGVGIEGAFQPLFHDRECDRIRRSGLKGVMPVSARRAGCIESFYVDAIIIVQASFCI